jgi:aspartate aminotransferase
MSVVLPRTSIALNKISLSPLFDLLSKAAVRKSQGHPVITLCAGEPDFNTPAHIIEAAHVAMLNGQTRYTPVAGTLALRQAICRKLERENGLSYSPSEVIATTGAKQALFNLCLAVLNPGDEVIIPAPYWPSYVDMVRLTGAREVIVPTEAAHDFGLQASALRQAITGRTKLLLLNSPGNPSGAIYSAKLLRELARELDEHPQIIVSSDEIYEHLNYSGEPYTSLLQAAPRLADRTVVINGVSKAFAMTGWRLGYAAGPSDLITAMEAVQSHSTSNPSSIAQAAAIAALDGSMDSVLEMCAAFAQRHAHLVTALNAIAGIRCRAAGGAFYLMPEMNQLIGAAHRNKHIAQPSDAEFCFWLLERHHLAVAAGSWFGLPNHVRISFAQSQDHLQEAVQRLTEVSDLLLKE